MRKAGKSNATGSRVEQLAAEWLARSGLRIIERNYATRFGEIDIIALDRDCLVFVEVRYRRTQSYGGAVQSVTRSKQRRLSACAADYLRRRRSGRAQPCRFDVLAASGHPDAPCFTWLRSAFVGSW